MALQDHYANQCATPVGTTCGTVTPSDRCECCDSKGGEDSDDSWCQVGRGAGAPVRVLVRGEQRLGRFCWGCLYEGCLAPLLQDNYTSECTKPPGSSCSSVSPGDR